METIAWSLIVLLSSAFVAVIFTTALSLTGGDSRPQERKTRKAAGNDSA
jgi:hypothetical protein